MTSIVREWIQTFAEFPIASLLFAVFIMVMTLLTGLWMESFLGSIANIVSTIKTVHVEHEQEPSDATQSDD